MKCVQLSLACRYEGGDLKGDLNTSYLFLWTWVDNWTYVGSSDDDGDAVDLPQHWAIICMLDGLSLDMAVIVVAQREYINTPTGNHSTFNIFNTETTSLSRRSVKLPSRIPNTRNSTSSSTFQFCIVFVRDKSCVINSSCCDPPSVHGG